MLDPPVPLQGEDQKLARNMLQRLLRKRLDQQLIRRAARLNIQNAPNRSQLTRLRNIIRSELLGQSPNPKCIAAFVKSVRIRQSTKSAFKNARVTDTNKPALDDWLDSTRQKIEEAAWCGALGLSPEDMNIEIGDVCAKKEIRDNKPLRQEYILRLIDAVLARELKRQACGEKHEQVAPG
ncbi:MAG: hypothetical protein L0H63_11060 [Nitrococcus sp.]|nr:hypothetical protein [Nitrococcus sp.]